MECRRPGPADVRHRLRLQSARRVDGAGRVGAEVRDRVDAPGRALDRRGHHLEVGRSTVIDGVPANDATCSLIFVPAGRVDPNMVRVSS
jgi:hypothetical protein